MLDGISLCMIVRDHAKELNRCLESIIGYVNEVVVVVDTRSSDEARAAYAAIERDLPPIQFIDFEWENESFADAREESFRHAKYKAVLWLDADDRVENPEAFREFAMQEIVHGSMDGLILPYNYTQDEHDNCTCYVHRERVVRNGVYRWQGEVHEVLVPVDEGYRPQVKVVPEIHDLDFNIVHDDNKKTSLARFKRVHDRLIKKREELGEKNIPMRDIYYLAVSARGMNQLEEAEEHYRTFIDAMSARDNRESFLFVARVGLGDILVHQGRTREAIEIYEQLITSWPEDGYGYQRVAECYKCLNQWDQAIMYAERCLNRKQLMVGMSLNPLCYDAYAWKILGLSYIGKNDMHNGVHFLEKCVEKIPDESEAQYVLSSAREAVRKEETFLAWKMLEGAITKDQDAESRMSHLVRAIPSEIVCHEYFKGTTYLRPVDPNKSVVFVNPEANALLDPHCRIVGTGGAEESQVIQAEEMAKRGYDVTIYANLKMDPKIHNDVRYLPMEHWMPEKEHGIVIAWRHPEILNAVTNAHMKILSLHDFVSRERVQKVDFDAVIFQCVDHAWEYAGIDEIKGKTHIVSLGIYPDEYIANSPYRDPYKCVYTSRPERGLIHILREWPRIKAAHPQATFFAFTHLDGLFNKWLTERPEMRDVWNESMQKVRELEGSGVMVNNAVGQGHLNSFMATCGFWLYPTEFRENFCYSAVKAQASGCIPIINRVGSLEETVHHDYDDGYPENDGWADLLIERMGKVEQSERDKVSSWAKEEFPVSQSIDGLEAVFEEVRESRKSPIAVEA